MTPRGFGEVATPAEPVPRREQERDAQGRLLCTGRRRNGKPCRAPAVTGQTTCRLHGGASPQAKRAARDRLADEADPSIARLVHERDHAPAAADRIRAANSLLDRAGLSRRQAIDVSSTTYVSIGDARRELVQKLLELRSAQPIAEGDAEAGDVVDAEIVDDEGEEER